MVMNNSFDVIVAGAGPAGLSCAEGLMDSGLHVLVLEKNDEIGPKTCAGGLTPMAGFYDLPPEKVRSFPSQVLLLNDRQRRRRQFRLDLRHPLRTVERSVLADRQLERIRGAGNISILKHTRILELRQNQVRTDQGDFSFRKLVGADGSRSIIRKALGLPFKFGCGLYYRIPAITDELTVFFDPARLRSGCIWVFPHVDHTNVGVGYNPLHIPTPRAKAELQKFISDQGYTRRGCGIRGAQLGYLYSGVDFDPVFLAGDAAGLVSKATGEGISAAIISGREIAARILDPGYRFPVLGKILQMKRRQEFLWTLFEGFPSLLPALLAGFFRVLEGDRVRSYFSHAR